jgi:PH (Pleckstrin Homology) domain-containing protein
VSSRQPPAGDRQVFRSAASLVVWWAWVAIAVITLADLAVQGRDHTAAVMAALVVAITGLVYGCAMRPRIIADPGGITVANPLRDHRVPWVSVVKVDVVNAVRVHCAPAPGGERGKVLYSWAVQATARSTRNARLRARRAARRARVHGLPGRPGYGSYPAEVQKALDRTPAEFAAHELDARAQRERAGRAASGGPEVRWAWAPIAAMALPVAALIMVASV